MFREFALDKEGKCPALVYEKMPDRGHGIKYKCIMIQGMTVGFTDYLDGEHYRFATPAERDEIIKNNLDSTVIQNYLMEI